MSLLAYTPEFSETEARLLALEKFGVEIVEIKSLPSERDQNFLINDENGDQFVLKFSNARESRERLVAQNEMMHRVSGQLTSSARTVESKNGQAIETIERASRNHFLRMVTFVPGLPMSTVRYHAPELLERLGEAVGQVTHSLEGLDCPALHRPFQWNLDEAIQVVEGRLHLIADTCQRKQIDTIVQRFGRHTVGHLASCPQSTIHGDLNDGNVIVGRNGDLGVIDFGDSTYGWTIGELAIAIAYAILEKPDPLLAAQQVLRGYARVRGPAECEIGALFGLVCVRLCVSAVLAAEQQVERPDDAYLSISQQPIRSTLPLLAEIPFEFAEASFRRTTELGPLDHNRRVSGWLEKQQSRFDFPLDMNGDQPNRFLVMDLGVASELLGSDENGLTEPIVTRIVENELVKNEAEVGVGRYLEPRLLYDSEIFSNRSLEVERRTIHLGIDLFAPAGEKIRAPFEGIVQLAEINEQPLDYGGLIVLRHETDDGESFFTLYGHLSHGSMDEMKPGTVVKQGEVFAALGDPSENGGWPPHLHFQIMTDMLDLGRDFPGVCCDRVKAIWSEFCPDPNLILQIPEVLFPKSPPDTKETLLRRKRLTAGSLKLAYESPLKMVRGWKHFLYDSTGRKYIDAFNNVPHVGHCNPQVVAAAISQLRLLNTNTRYLSDRFNEFAQRLADTMPNPLDVCLFVNSASEANELALRMARAKTGNRELIVLEGAYHGNTTTLIEISPYKHAARGGSGPASWVHTAPLPDVYRGPFKNRFEAGHQYGAAVGELIQQLKLENKGLCGFIAESCPSVGGQIIFPDGYLSDVYQRVRAAGGVCIADDVQTGYGRLGNAFYGFELQNVVPDMVILGKPIGNGFPLAAVVTTREIAEAFDNGMEYFSTFGGNPVACTVGMAVLDVVEQEKMQANARAVGDHLVKGLEQLKESHRIVGDIRGTGFFLGMELVRDRATLEAADRETSFVTNRMRDRGVLVGTEGPLHNVIKIRPPMTFTNIEADILLAALDQSLGEL